MIQQLHPPLKFRLLGRDVDLTGVPRWRVVQIMDDLRRLEFDATVAHAEADLRAARPGPFVFALADLAPGSVDKCTIL